METVRRCPTSELVSVDGPTAHCAVSSFSRRNTPWRRGIGKTPGKKAERGRTESLVGEYQSDGQAQPSVKVPTSFRKLEKGPELGDGVVGTDNEEAVPVLPREALVPFRSGRLPCARSKLPPLPFPLLILTS